MYRSVSTTESKLSCCRYLYLLCDEHYRKAFTKPTNTRHVFWRYSYVFLCYASNIIDSRLYSRSFFTETTAVFAKTSFGVRYRTVWQHFGNNLMYWIQKRYSSGVLSPFFQTGMVIVSFQLFIIFSSYHILWHNLQIQLHTSSPPYFMSCVPSSF